MCKSLKVAACITVILAAASTSRALVIGDWERNMDGWVIGAGWVVGEDPNVVYDDVNGVTLGQHSLGIHMADNSYGDGWNQDILTLDILANGLLEAFKDNQRVTVDVTWKMADWPLDPIPGWNGIHMVINAGGADWSQWLITPEQADWTVREGNDVTVKAVFEYSQWFDEMRNLEGVTWLEFRLVSNCNDAAYKGPVVFYLDNMELLGAGKALAPRPDDYSADLSVDTTLTWDAGAFVAFHDVYFGRSEEAVADASKASDPSVVYARTTTPSFDPGTLEFNTRYFWRVDEINDVNPDSPWVGPVWSFTTANFIVVDDFEGYTMDSPNRVFQTWIDGWGFSGDEFLPFNAGNGTGSTVGNDPSTGQIMEVEFRHGGAQSMPMDYNNGEKSVSEAVRTWDEPQDWTANQFDLFKIYVRGFEGNSPDRLYITIEDAAGAVATLVYPDPAVLTVTSWTEWAVPLSDITGVNLASVKKMTIGIGNPGNPSGGIGRVLIDDVRIGLRPVGLVAHYALDGTIEDSSGNGFHGALGDEDLDAVYVAGPPGFNKALSFDGRVSGQRVELGTFNPSAATGQLSVALWAKWGGLTNQWQGLIGKKFSAWSRDAMMWQIEIHQTSGALRVQREGANDVQIDADGLTVGEWAHVAFTCDGATCTTYLNGTMANQGAFTFGYALDAPVQFGCSSIAGGNPFKGVLDEVRLYDVVLSEAEIQALMTP